MDFILNFANLEDEDTFTDSKKDVITFLKMIGVDTRFISYTPEKIYINNLRFSKFSKKREKTFNNTYRDIEVVRSGVFQKICLKSSRVLSNMNPKDKILIPECELYDLMYIILEPYTRKYGVQIVSDGDYNLKADPLILDEKVNGIFTDIFNGDGINFPEDENKIYPLINVPRNWIDSFLKIDCGKTLEKSPENLANDFMMFLEEVAPQYKDNVLKASNFIEKKIRS